MADAAWPSDGTWKEEAWTNPWARLYTTVNAYAFTNRIIWTNEVLVSNQVVKLSFTNQFLTDLILDENTNFPHVNTNELRVTNRWFLNATAFTNTAEPPLTNWLAITVTQSCTLVGDRIPTNWVLDGALKHCLLDCFLGACERYDTIKNSTSAQPVQKPKYTFTVRDETVNLKAWIEESASYFLDTRKADTNGNYLASLTTTNWNWVIGGTNWTLQTNFALPPSWTAPGLCSSISAPVWVTTNTATNTVPGWTVGQYSNRYVTGVVQTVVSTNPVYFESTPWRDLQCSGIPVGNVTTCRYTLLNRWPREAGPFDPPIPTEGDLTPCVSGSSNSVHWKLSWTEGPSNVWLFATSIVGVVTSEVLHVQLTNAVNSNSFAVVQRDAPPAEFWVAPGTLSTDYGVCHLRAALKKLVHRGNPEVIPAQWAFIQSVHGYTTFAPGSYETWDLAKFFAENNLVESQPGLVIGSGIGTAGDMQPADPFGGSDVEEFFAEFRARTQRIYLTRQETNLAAAADVYVMTAKPDDGTPFFTNRTLSATFDAGATGLIEGPQLFLQTNFAAGTNFIQTPLFGSLNAPVWCDPPDGVTVPARGYRLPGDPVLILRYDDPALTNGIRRK